MSRGPATRSSSAVDSIPFLVLPENQLAYSAATQLRESRSSRSHPVLTITGPSGVGKSHLVSQVFSARRGGLARVIEITADEFVHEWIEAVRTRQVVEMCALYLEHDILVCEDLQSFRSSPAAQNAYVTLMDDYISGGGRVIVTASAPVHEIRGLTSRLVSRCHGGTTVAIPLPDCASRIKLLKHFAAQVQVPIAMDALEALAEPDGQSPLELRGQWRRVVQAAELQRCPIDRQFVHELLTKEPTVAPQRVADVAREVARQFGVTLKELRSQSRVAPTRLPRQAAMYLSREVTTAACAEIGAYFDGRTHSTVVYACEQFEQQLTGDPRLAALTDSIRQSLSRRGRRNHVNNRPTKRRASG